MDAFESALRALFVKEARGYHFVHAGCVGWRGRAIVVPGFSRAGTSTLVRALVDRGATHYSDAFALFDRRGRVHAFPAALRLQTSEGAGRRMSREREACAPLPLGLVVQTAYYEGAEWRPQPLAPAETVLALMPHAARANVEPAAVKSVLARAASFAVGIRTPRGDAAEAAARILEQLDDDTRTHLTNGQHNGDSASERSDASQPNGASRRSGERERLGVRGAKPRIRLVRRACRTTCANHVGDSAARSQRLSLGPVLRPPPRYFFAKIASSICAFTLASTNFSVVTWFHVA